MSFLETVLTSAATSLLASGGVVFAYLTYRRQYMLLSRAERVARLLMGEKRYNFRTFKTIQHHLGGFEDNELRRLLVQSGGVRFTDAEGIEIWGLYDRVKSHLEQEVNTRDN